MRLMLLAMTAAVTLAMAAPVAAQENENPSLLERAAVSRAKGSTDAPLLIYEIADFQCPYCARFAEEVFPQIDEHYVRTGKVRWVFINMPMPSHGRAWSASEAALCAGAVADRFWAMHDRLFESQREWRAARTPAEYYHAYAENAGVPAEAFRDCIAHDRVAALLLQDLLGAARSGISGTPTFILNEETKIVGLKPFKEWRALLDEALEEAAAGDR